MDLPSERVVPRNTSITSDIESSASCASDALCEDSGSKIQSKKQVTACVHSE